MPKIIIVQWIPEASFYTKAMQVISSDHERFVVGSRFDYGFFNMATDEGYTIVSLPMANSEEDLEDDQNTNASQTSEHECNS